MELVRYNPMRDIFGLPYRFNRRFGNFFSPVRRSERSASAWNWNPKVNVADKDDSLVLNAELPGVEKKDITVELNGRVLTLRGERSSDSESKEEKYHRKERFYGKFERSFTLPEGVDPDAIEANHKDGVLTVSIPKPESEKPRKITVN